MPRSGPRKVVRYLLEFKLTAVRLSQLAGVKVKDVAESLAIHPFMAGSSGQYSSSRAG